MDELWEHVGDHGLAICSNGGIVYDVARPRGAHRPRRSPSTSALEVAALIRDGDPGHRPSRSRRPPASAASPTSCERHAGRPTGAGRARSRSSSTTRVKLLARHEELDPEEFWAAAEAAVGDLVDHHLVVARRPGRDQRRRRHQGDARWRCSAPSSGSAAEEVVAFGDMPNDLPMLDVGRHVVRDGQRAPQRPRAGRPHRARATRTTASPRCWRSSSACDLVLG